MQTRMSPPDPVMTLSVLAMLAMSFVIVTSASLDISQVRYGYGGHIALRWAIYIPIGLALAWGVSRVDVRWWQAAAIPLLAISLLVLIATQLPWLGRSFNGAQRWINLGGLTLQPIELIKPVVILYMAHYMSSFPDRLRTFSRGMLPMMVVLFSVSGLLLAQPDFGNIALLSSVCFLMWLVGGVPVRQLFFLFLLMVVLLGIMVVSEPYRMARMMAFVDPWDDPLGKGYQLIQSMLAFGVGGLSGLGIGQGVQKLFYLPEPFTDFVLAILAEELGLAGVLFVFLLFGFMMYRGIQISRNSTDQLSALLVFGCVALMSITFFINAAAVMGLIPTKGMPMPFFSYGGSALLGNCILLGLVLAVQRRLPVNRKRMDEQDA